MNMKAIQRLLNLLPDGPKKEQLMAKFAKAQGQAKDGLHDVFEFAAKGHIKIEQIDEKGNVMGVLADQANLVVDGAEEILLRAFSGDPDRTLYKVRIPKSEDGTKTFHIAVDGISEVVDGVDQLKYAPNVYWKAVEDDEFDISYGYRPKTVYLKEEASMEVGKKAFKIYPKPVSGGIPITSEIYSTQTNLFIGLGDGENAPIALDDSRLKYTGDWTDEDGAKVAGAPSDSVTFEEKISNFAVEFATSESGARAEILVNDLVVDTVETFSATPGIKKVEFKGYDHTATTKVQIRFKDAAPSIEEPKLVIKSFHSDALSKDMNKLIHEFENFTNNFDTVTSYNTTNVAPFYTQLEHYPVDPDSVVVDYGSTAYERVGSLDEVTEGKYYLDAKTGKLYFNRTLSGLLIKYHTTGERYLLKPHTAFTATTVTRSIKNEVPDGAIDGTNTKFQLSKVPVNVGSLKLRLVEEGGSDRDLVANVDYTINVATGEVILTSAPVEGQALVAEYKSDASGRFIELPHAIDSVKVLDFATGAELSQAVDEARFDKGMFLIDASNKKRIIVSDQDASGASIVNYEILYRSSEAPGFETGYTRQVIEKPKIGIAYPWYQLDKGSVSFIAEFPEGVPNHNVTIREMILANGPRKDDNIDGFNDYPVDAFSIVRVGETRKEVTTGIRVTWTITLLNKDGNPFYGGY